MSIILRTNKGSALTYDEMDRNQSQFFYSSSLHDSNTKLRLHFTGSDSLDLPGVDYGPTRYHEIQFPSVDIEIPEGIADGNNTQIQFNRNGTFGADSLFVFNETGNLLGIGTNAPLTRIDVSGDSQNQAALSLRGYAAGTGNEKQAKINFYEGSTFIGRIGRTDGNNGNIYITNNHLPNPTKFPNLYGKVHISIGNSGADNNEVAGTFTRNEGISRFGVGTTEPNRAGTFIGGGGIGISSTSFNTNQSYIQTIPDGIYNAYTVEGFKKLIPNESDSAGLLISSPNTLNGGNVVVALNTDGFEHEGFNIIKSSNGSYANSEVIASFQVSGKVGINTNFPSDVGLTVAGIISGSGNAQIDGTLTVGTVAAVTGTGTNKTLVADSNGLINYLPAAPVPFGGIIMWAGNTNAVPEGWLLCNLGSSVTTELGTRFVPDLTNKFIIGWNGDEAGSGPKTDITDDGEDTVQGGSKDAIVVSHTHGITDLGHSHDITRRWTPGAVEPANLGQGNDGGNMTSTARSSTEATGISVNYAGTDGTNKNLPPYYALAFIIYVGV
jgi:hypothetical protein